jgi:hypothetical protein
MWRDGAEEPFTGQLAVTVEKQPVRVENLLGQRLPRVVRFLLHRS